MFRNNYRFIAVMAVLGVAVFFAVSSVAAEETCEAPNVLYLPSEADWEWKVSLDSMTLLGDGSYEYVYSVAEPGGTTSGLDFIALTFPDCCPEAIVITPEVPNKTKIFAVGEGEPTTGFGVGNYQAFVVKYTPSPGAVDMKFTANSGKKGKASVAIKAGKKMFYGEIAGIDCPGFAQKMVTVSKKIITEDGQEFCIEEDPYTQCGKLVPCPGSNAMISDPIPLDQLLTDQQTGEKVTVLLNPSAGGGCPSFTIKSGENSYYYYCSGGRCYYYYY